MTKGRSSNLDEDHVSDLTYDKLLHIYGKVYDAYDHVRKKIHFSKKINFSKKNFLY